MGRSLTILGKLSVLPFSYHRISHPGSGWPVGVTQINPHKRSPASSLVHSLSGNPGEEIVQVADHSGGIKYERRDLDNSKPSCKRDKFNKIR